MGRGRRQEGRGGGHRPHFDSFVSLDEVLADKLADKVALPVHQAHERGVIGWCVTDDACSEICATSASPLNLHDVPVPVALKAWDAGWLSFDNMLVVLAAHDQVMKQGDETVVDDEDGHFYGVCWCGETTELALRWDVAALSLERHCESAHSYAAIVL